ncbi:MFS transporter, partial [Stenotrophomonas maltophilia group sp. RNC7]|nr:MFS transporter [Stenotrophomonas maltophilia group sp. RNC7]
IYSVTISGLVVLATALGVFATQAETTVLAISAFLVIGFSGASLSPALIARVMRVAEPGALVNSVHVSIINSGLAFIAWAGGVGIDAGHGYKSPLWIGFLLALLALATLTPRKVRGAMTQC